MKRLNPVLSMESSLINSALFKSVSYAFNNATLPPTSSRLPGPKSFNPLYQDCWLVDLYPPCNASKSDLAAILDALASKFPPLIELPFYSEPLVGN